MKDTRKATSADWPPFSRQGTDIILSPMPCSSFMVAMALSNLLRRRLLALQIYICCRLWRISSRTFTKTVIDASPLLRNDVRHYCRLETFSLLTFSTAGLSSNLNKEVITIEHKRYANYAPSSRRLGVVLPRIFAAILKRNIHRAKD